MTIPVPRWREFYNPLAGLTVARLNALRRDYAPPPLMPVPFPHPRALARAAARALA